LRIKGYDNIAVLKATGTAGFGELQTYLDFGASAAFDCVDFGLPTTYPAGRAEAPGFFERALDWLLSIKSQALLVECGGDLLGANVPTFLDALLTRRKSPKVVLAAADAFGAAGAIRFLSEKGVRVSLITGPCTDTQTLRSQTQKLCGIAAMNLTSGEAQAALL
jgi:hypothetical protein